MNQELFNSPARAVVGTIKEFAFNVDSDSSVLHASVSPEVLDMEYVFGAVIFCRGFPSLEWLKMNLLHR
jgi:hypothetical protein